MPGPGFSTHQTCRCEKLELSYSFSVMKLDASCLKYSAFFTVAVLVNAACAPSQVRPVSAASGLAGDEFALVAFSADSIEPLAFRSLEIVTFSDSNRPGKASEVSIHPDNGTGQLFLYEFSVEVARFGVAGFEYEAERWESVGQGPEFSVEPGTLTYLGRIQMPLVQIGTYADSGREYPASARIVMTDASEEDLQRLVVHFPSTANMPLNKAIPETWGDSESVTLRYVPQRRNRPRPHNEEIDPLHDPPIPTEEIFEPTEIPPQ